VVVVEVVVDDVVVEEVVDDVVEEEVAVVASSSATLE
jgi:hypothetical protein